MDKKDLRRIKYGLKLLEESLKEGKRPRMHAKWLNNQLDCNYDVCEKCEKLVPVKMLSYIDWEKKHTIYMNICPICDNVFKASVSKH